MSFINAMIYKGRPPLDLQDPGHFFFLQCFFFYMFQIYIIFGESVSQIGEQVTLVTQAKKSSDNER
jgi:hypothetical protein